MTVIKFDEKRRNRVEGNLALKMKDDKRHSKPKKSSPMKRRLKWYQKIEWSYIPLFILFCFEEARIKIVELAERLDWLYVAYIALHGVGSCASIFGCIWMVGAFENLNYVGLTSEEFVLQFFKNIFIAIYLIGSGIAIYKCRELIPDSEDEE